MERKYYMAKNGELYPPIPRKPSPKGTNESTGSLYHIAVMILFGLLLCFVMGALDYVSEDMTPVSNMTETLDNSIGG